MYDWLSPVGFSTLPPLTLFNGLRMNRILALSALSMAIGVACGAFGAHGLRDVISANDMQIWEKAVLYQLIHSLAALIVIATPATVLSNSKARLVSSLLLFGIMIFSGSLYTLVLTNQRWLGAITPIGGTSFIAAWLILAVAAWRGSSHSR